MPNFIHGKSTKVLVNAADLSGWFQDASPAATADATETTCYGQNSKTYIVGLIDGKLTLKGLFDSTSTILGNTTGVDGFLWALLGSGAVVTVTIIKGGVGAIGDRVVAVGMLDTGYTLDSPVADVVNLQIDGQVTGGLQSGVLLHPFVNETTTGNSTAVDNGTVVTSTAFGGYAVLHAPVNSIANTSIVKVQHSVDSTTWVDLATYPTLAASTPGSSQVFVTGTVNRYLRDVHTLGAGGGNLTYASSFTRFQD